MYCSGVPFDLNVVFGGAREAICVRPEEVPKNTLLRDFLLLSCTATTDGGHPRK